MNLGSRGGNWDKDFLANYIFNYEKMLENVKNFCPTLGNEAWKCYNAE